MCNNASTEAQHYEKCSMYSVFNGLCDENASGRCLISQGDGGIISEGTEDEDRDTIDEEAENRKLCRRIARLGMPQCRQTMGVF